MATKPPKKPCTKKPTHDLPQYQKRRTVADHVKDNMLCSGKQNYHQRIIFVAHHNTDKKDRFKEIRKILNKLVIEKNQQAASDKLTGLMIFYSMYSMYLLEGGEDNIGNLIKSLKADSSLFGSSRVVVVYNNSNRVSMRNTTALKELSVLTNVIIFQRFFEKMFYAYAKPHAKLSQDNALEHEVILKDIINRLTKISLTIIANPTTVIDDKSHLKLPDKKILPSTEMIDQILQISSLQTIEEFADIYGCVPEFFDYETHVWPHPYDLLPDNVFDWGKFDVNLTRK